VAAGRGTGLRAASPSTSQGFTGRQYYGGWSSYRSYSYRPYYYKPYPSYSGYRHNYVLYYPAVSSVLLLLQPLHQAVTGAGAR